MVAPQPSVHLPPMLVEAANAEKDSRRSESTIRFRSMRECDLPAVSLLLASEVVGENKASNHHRKPTAFDWNQCKSHLERIRQKVLLETELRYRLQAIQEGRNVWSKLLLHSSRQQHQGQQPDAKPSSSSNKHEQQYVLRWLWSHETFRSKVQCAVQLHQKERLDQNSDPHHHPFCWDDHNMNLIPGDSSWLQHVMIVAEDTEKLSANGRIARSAVVGFCEVGRMSTPLYYAARKQDDGCNDCDEKLWSAPTILNLVISPHARRRGIATSLVASAERYVRRIWGEHQLCLYVTVDNHQALSLYQRLGFVPSHMEHQQQISESPEILLRQQQQQLCSDDVGTSEETTNRFRHLRRQFC